MTRYRNKSHERCLVPSIIFHTRATSSFIHQLIFKRNGKNISNLNEKINCMKALILKWFTNSTCRRKKLNVSGLYNFFRRLFYCNVRESVTCQELLVSELIIFEDVAVSFCMRMFQNFSKNWNFWHKIYLRIKVRRNFFHRNRNLLMLSVTW